MSEQKKRIGAFWAKTSAMGNTFYSGSIEIEGKTYSLVMFTNNKRPDKQDPDFSIFESSKPQTPSTAPAQPPKQAARPQAPKPAAIKRATPQPPVEVSGDDEVPF